MKGITIKDGADKKWIYLSDAMRGGVLGVYADYEDAGVFARICTDEKRAKEFFNREQRNGNIVYFCKPWSTNSPCPVIMID